jgi:hypothetical protein
MKKLLLFSEKIPDINRQFQFAGKRAVRWLSIIFKRKRSLQIIALRYYRYWHFENAYLIIEFEFRNAIWLKIGDKKFINLKTPLVLNLANVSENTITLTIQGLYQLLTYEIDLSKETRINKYSLSASMQNLHAKLVPPTLYSPSQLLHMNTGHQQVRIDDISMSKDNIKITPTPFKLQYYI